MSIFRPRFLLLRPRADSDVYSSPLGLKQKFIGLQQLPSPSMFLRPIFPHFDRILPSWSRFRTWYHVFSTWQAKANGLSHFSGFLKITMLPTSTLTAFYLRTRLGPNAFGSLNLPSQKVKDLILDQAKS